MRGNTPQEPPEIRIIKNFVRDAFQADCSVVAKPQQITIVVRSSALAGTLRMHIVEIQALLEKKQKILIRIG